MSFSSRLQRVWQVELSSEPQALPGIILLQLARKDWRSLHYRRPGIAGPEACLVRQEDPMALYWYCLLRLLLSAVSLASSTIVERTSCMLSNIIQYQVHQLIISLESAGNCKRLVSADILLC